MRGFKYDLNSKWSRIINEEHRIVYIATEDIIYIESLKGHY
ncbi:type II toxin-antitoxin system YoeB family toxin [Pedobacter terrae]